jgi:tRNA A-37 threonylcarbamoyl transferase component Bud32/ABC-type branched-subunit amino acid transport system substrate-binding protein
VPASQCLTEETIAELVEGRLEGERFASAERHVSQCDRCMRLVDAVGGAMASGVQPPSTKRLPAPLVPGAHVGRYEIVEPVGAGGMGRVYAAIDPVLDRRVALKLLHPHAATDEMETRLLREAKAMARLSHPEVMPVYDAGRYADQLFIAMEFVEGCTLRQWLAREKRPWREVLAVFQRAGRGLARAHEAGIVHRDFKPDNVLVGDDGRVRVTDFGLARAVQAPEPEAAAEGADDTLPDDTAEAPLTRTGVLLGTPAYMAPEQHVGAPTDERSDIYSFCVALYEGLYGDRPFPGPSPAAIVAQKDAGTVAMPKDEHGVPRRLRRVILRGLQPKPEDRPASMAGLLEALEDASRVARRWLAPAVLGALLVAGGAAWGARGFHRSSPAGPAPSTAADVRRECTTHADCARSHGGEPWACRPTDGTCVAMASEDCTPMFEPGDLDARDAVWLGAMFPVKGPPYGKMNMDGVDMARREFARETTSLSGANAAMHVRRIAVVGCDDSVDPKRAATHLVQDVGVPAILGFYKGKELVELANSLLIARRVLSVATLTSSPLIMQVPQPPELPRLIWRTSYSIVAAAAATAAFLPSAIEPIMRRPRTRVTLVREDAAYILPFAQELYRGLVFNGRPAADNGNDYHEVIFGDPSNSEQVERAAGEVIAARPTIVVLLGSAEELRTTVDRVEKSWPAGEPRPWYVAAENTTAVLESFIGTSAERRHRVFAVSQADVPVLSAHFVLRFNLEYPGEATSTITPATAYDAFYMLAYAVAAQREAAVSGAAIGGSIRRLLPPGRTIQSGPTDILAALTALSRGESIDLTGPSGSLDFDPVTGEWSPDFSLLCSVVGADAGAGGDVESGVTYVGKDRTVEGKLRCP